MDGFLPEEVALGPTPPGADQQDSGDGDEQRPCEDAISAQSSDFDVISGATVTWEAWGASLESALYEAGV